MTADEASEKVERLVRGQHMSMGHYDLVPRVWIEDVRDALPTLRRELKERTPHTKEVEAALAALDSAVFESTKATKPHRHAALATVSEAIHTLHAHVERLGHELTAAKRALEPHENAGVVPTGATGRGEK
jgi:hypothetical protein